MRLAARLPCSKTRKFLRANLIQYLRLGLVALRMNFYKCRSCHLFKNSSSLILTDILDCPRIERAGRELLTRKRADFIDTRLWSIIGLDEHSSRVSRVFTDSNQALIAASNLSGVRPR